MKLQVCLPFYANKQEIGKSPKPLLQFIIPRRSWSGVHGSEEHRPPEQGCRTTESPQRRNTNRLIILALSVDLTSQTHTNTTRDVTNTLAPDLLVDSRVNDDLLSVHGLLGELADHIHGTRSLSLESTKNGLDSFATMTERKQHQNATYTL